MSEVYLYKKSPVPESGIEVLAVTRLLDGSLLQCTHKDDGRGHHSAIVAGFESGTPVDGKPVWEHLLDVGAEARDVQLGSCFYVVSHEPVLG